MNQGSSRRAQGIGPGYVRAGWALLVIAVLAILVPVLATAAQPHVVWLFSTSYGAVGMVLGGTLIHGARSDRRS